MVYPMPDEVNGPYGDRYALCIRDNDEGMEFRMVHYEGVAYVVDADRPWCWTDYDDSQPKFTTSDLFSMVAGSPAAGIDALDGVDLADWIRTFGDRLETNFSLVYQWANR
jgi:hypothetical protein